MPFSARDDRDHPISVLRPKDIRRAADAEDPARAHLAIHLRNAIRAESQRFSLFSSAWAIVAFILWIVVQVIVRKSGLGRYPGVSMGAFIGGIIILIIMGREITRRRVSRMVAATAVAEGICGQCCYSLKDVPTEPDGRITCPECGAAWLHERITRTHWQVETLAPTFHDEQLPWPVRFKRRCIRFITSTPKPSNLIAPDDRGRFVNTVDSRLLSVPRSRREELGRQRVAVLRHRARKKGAILRFLVCLPTAAVAGLLFWGAFSSFDDRDRDVALVAACAGVFFVIVSIAINLGHGFLPPTHTSRMLVADGLCGCCISSIEGLPVDPDGCATCPTCGAAWRKTPQMHA